MYVFKTVKYSHEVNYSNKHDSSGNSSPYARCMLVTVQSVRRENLTFMRRVQVNSSHTRQTIKAHGSLYGKCLYNRSVMLKNTSI